MELTEAKELLVFKAISTFVIELGRLYEKDHIPLGLYKRLILKTKVAHIKPIKKHIQAFKSWIESNAKALETQDSFVFDEKNCIIKYSDNVYINMKKIFEIVKDDSDVKNTIWKHLKTIGALIDGGRGTVIVADKKYDKEKDFISEIMKKVETHVDPNADPTQTLNNMMTSGIFTDLLGSMNEKISSGTLDINHLLGLTSNMINTLQKNMK